MNKENELTKYEELFTKEIKDADGILEGSNVNVMASNSTQKEVISKCKKDLANSNKQDNTQISSIEQKRTQEIEAATNALNETIEHIREERQLKGSELTKSVNDAKKQKIETADQIAISKQDIQGSNKLAVESNDANYQKIVAARNETIAVFEQENKDTIENLKAANKEKVDDLNNQIKEAVSNYFVDKKKLDDDANKEIAGKKLEIESKNKIVDEKIQLVSQEYENNRKSVDEILKKPNISKEETNQANKRTIAFTKAYTQETKLLNIEKTQNDKEFQLFEAQTNKTLDKSQSDLRIAAINNVTTIQGKIDVANKELAIALENQRVQYTNGLDVLILEQLKEKEDNDYLVANQNNQFQLAMDGEEKKSLIAEKVEARDIELLGIERKYFGAGYDNQVYLATKDYEIDKEKLISNYQIEIEKLLAKIDIDNFTFEKDSKESFLNGQKNALEFKKPVFDANNNVLNNTMKIVDTYKSNRIGEAVVPFIDSINNLLADFQAKYASLMENQTIENAKLLSMLETAHTKKMSFIKDTKKIIKDTDVTSLQIYEGLEAKEIKAYENTLDEVKKMNDSIIVSYQNKIEKEKTEAKEAIDRLMKLNEEINNEIKEADEKSLARLSESGQTLSNYYSGFDAYYEAQTRLNNETYQNSVNDRNNKLNQTILLIEKNLAEFIEKANVAKADDILKKEAFEAECNKKTEENKTDYANYVIKVNNEHSLFEAQLNVQLSNLGTKNKQEYTVASNKNTQDKLARGKSLMKTLNLLNKEITKINSSIPKNIKLNIKNATIEKNKTWWIIEK